jgi:hypothetical protein
MAREETPHKRWKFTGEYWRSREKWDDYELAVNDIVEHTSTHTAPWVLIEGNDKRFARIKVINTFCDRLERMLSINSRLRTGQHSACFTASCNCRGYPVELASVRFECRFIYGDLSVSFDLCHT